MPWKTPEDRLYTKTDEWVMLDGQSALIGITDYAQDQLSDIVYLELPTIDESFSKDDIFATVESVKAAADVNMPVMAKITEVNNDLEDQPELINLEPYEGAWFVKIDVQDVSQVEELMDASTYADYCDSRSS
ncbi:MAG: glycine cleavage system protein H [Anaerolineaceae bacterium]|nr:glycine cleavage system protein H [Anaerolineaceae bacterium]